MRDSKLSQSFKPTVKNHTHTKIDKIFYIENNQNTGHCLSNQSKASKYENACRK